MRDSFARFMTAIAKEREDVCLLSGDIGNRMFDKYKEVAPKRFFNCGIAESNMMSVAAGMALSGIRPVVYTITPFTTTRCLEQIKIGAAYHDVPIIIVGTGSGLSYSELGPTHHSLEDIAIIRSLPNIRIMAPSDSEELKIALQYAIEAEGPSYIRIGKKGEPDLGPGAYQQHSTNARILRDGSDAALIGIGPILGEGLVAAEILAKKGIDLEVTSMSSVKPLDKEFLQSLSGRITTWVTLEEHSISGGLGTAVIEWINDVGSPIRVTRIGTPDRFINRLGNQEFTRKELGINAESIACAIEERLGYQ